MKNVTNYILRSNGEDFAQAFKVKGIIVLHEANKISRAKVLLLDGDVSEQDFALSKTDFFKPGNSFEIEIGFENEVHKVFDGIITNHALKIQESNMSTLEIECKHKSVKLTRSKTNKFFYDMSDKAIVEEILNENGLEYQITSWPEYTHAQLVQNASTNWEFILSRADANGLLVFSEPGSLLIAPPDPEQEEVLNCEYGANVLEFEAAINNEFQSPKIKGITWSPDEQSTLSAEGTPGYNNAMGNLSTEMLAETWGDQFSLYQHCGHLTEDELSSWANSAATRNELAKVIGRVRIKGTHEVLPGKVIRLSGFGERFNGKALVTGVRHELQKGNWTTDIQFGIAPLWYMLRDKAHSGAYNSLVPGIFGCHTGVVTQLENDPGNGFRVKVNIPVMDPEGEGVWARILQPYAGAEYGFCFYPEIGDEVILGFLQDDPRHPIVLGSVYSGAKHAPQSIADENHLKGIYTRSGMKLTFEDEQKIIQISTPSGNIFSIDESSKSICIKDEHSNLMEMNAEGITLESKKNVTIKADKDIELEGMNIKIKAAGKFAAEGNAGADVTSSAIAVLKGSMVQIN